MANTQQVLGCDFSHWHPCVNGVPFKNAGHGFGIAKVSEGGSSGARDKTWYSSRDHLLNANLPVGGYHFYRFRYTPLENANNFIGGMGDPSLLHIPPCLDLEDLDLRKNANQAADDVLQFLHIIEQHTGVTPIFYTGGWYFNGRIRPRGEFVRYPLWIASYTSHAPVLPHPWTDYWAWQYTDHTRVNGAPGSYDCSLTTVDKYVSVLRNKPKPPVKPGRVDAPDGTPGILVGEISSKVVQLQACLNYAIGSHLKIDGIFGGGTQHEVQNVQKFFGLTPVSGNYGPKTQWVLQIAVNNKD